MPEPSNGSRRINLEWIDSTGNPRKLDIEGPGGFVTFWMRKLAGSAVDEMEVPEASEGE